MARMGPGFRFHPTDEELVSFYLKRKMTGKLSHYDHIAVVDVYKLEPWDLPPLSKLRTKDLEWYFFSALDRKYGNGSRTNRATEKGYWKTTGKDRPVSHDDRTVGMKKTLVYHMGRAPQGRRTNWVMHEYKMVDAELARAGTVLKDVYVVCRIFEKSGAGPKNGAKYGAPLDDKAWDVDDEVEQEEVALLPPPPYDEVFDAVSTGAYVETNDLDKKLDLSDMIGTITFPSSNFHRGECSTHTEHSQEVIKYQEPLAGTFEISGPENGLSQQHGVSTNSENDGDNGELSDIKHLLDFNDASNDMDLDLFLDATENLPTVYDGSFLETNDLLNVSEDNPTEANPIDADSSVNDMLDEYLTLPDDEFLALPDDDVCKYISFDYPQIPVGANSIPNQGSPLTQQNVEGETSDIAVVSKHDSEVQSSNEASSVQNPQEAKLVPGNTNPFAKRAYGWLASIPAAPAHAYEFPAKEIALGLHPAAQSPAHITTGMISITDITFRGNAMDWTMGKNEGFNTLISTGFSQPDVNSAALMPVSGKTAFVLSHGWIFLTGFSVLILSLSFKIGSIMYTYE
ncbi:hypothetical protein VNO78_19939 [Psophocarpus tetragonolobus]|uniref:NAC domain-containing protein n=1 Tax=Psophocarpus tetragonolobus TaxID=3891 RepID=A0AAN9XH30_PSOTE